MNNQLFNPELLKDNTKESFKQYIQSKKEQPVIKESLSSSQQKDLQVIQRFNKEIVSIDSKFRNILEYPNSNNFKSFLGKSFKNVIKIKLVSTQIPNVEQVIRELPYEIQNNLISWQNEDDYNLGIRTGCPFEYLPASKVINITVSNHELTVGTKLNVFFSNSSLSAINLVGYREVSIIDTNTIQIDYNAITNYIGTITVDIGIPVYTISLIPGNYTSSALASEIQLQMNKILRKNGEYHYFTVNVNNKTDIFTFSNYSIQKLLPDSVSTTIGTNVIEITHINHGFKNRESVYINGIPKLGGVSTDLLNGIFTIINVTLDTFQYLITTTASISVIGGSNSIIICKSLPFRFLFDTENTRIQYNIGFPDENSAEYIGNVNPITTNILDISSIQNNIPDNFTTITTTQPHLLKGSTFNRITAITTNGSPVYLTTESNHFIEKEIDVFFTGFTSTPNINNSYTVKPITENTLQIIDTSLIITSNTTNYNNTYIYQLNDSIDFINLTATPYKSEFNSLKNIPIYSIVSEYSFTIKMIFRYLDTDISSSKIGTSKIKLQHTSHSFNNSIEMYSNGDIPTYTGTSDNYNSINVKTINNTDYANTLRTDSILLENNNSILASSSRNIITITNPSTGIIEFQLNTHYFYTIGETITVTGTNSLDGIYTISNVSSLSPMSPAPYNLYEMNYIQIQSTETDITFSGSPTIVPAFHSVNTVRLIDYHSDLITNNIINVLYISNSSNTPSISEYLIQRLSEHSYTLKFVHTIAVPLSTCTIQHKNETVTFNDTKQISPQLNGEYNFFNKFPLENITGQINLGDASYITDITSNIANTGYNSDLSIFNIPITTGEICCSYIGDVIYAVNTTILTPIFNTLNAYTSNRMYHNIYFSDNYGITFKNISPFVFTNLSNIDIIIIVNNGGLDLNNTYLSNKIGLNGIYINYTHISIVPDTNIQLYTKYGNSSVYINAKVIDNDPLYCNYQSDILSIDNFTGEINTASYGEFKRITLDTLCTVVPGDSITILGTNSLDGTYLIYNLVDVNYVDFSEPTIYVFIKSSILDNTFGSTPTLTLLGTQTGTLKIIIPPIISNGIYFSDVQTSSDGRHVYIPIAFSNQLLYLNNNNNNLIWEYKSIPNTVAYSIQLTVSETGQGVVIYTLNNLSQKQMYLSNDYGDTFYNIIINEIGSTLGSPRHKASKSFRYHTIFYNAPFYTDLYKLISNDFGVTWKQTFFSNTLRMSISSIKGLIISNDGRYQTITLQQKTSPYYTKVYNSSDYGENFNLVFTIAKVDNVNGGNGTFHNLSSDYTGRYILISGYDDIYYSNDYGISWNNFISNPLLYTFYPTLNIAGSFTPLSGNGKIFYFINEDAVSGLYELIKWDTTSQELIFQTESNLNYFAKNDTITIKDCDDSFVNGSYTINEIVSTSEFKITPNTLIVPYNYANYGNVTNNNRLNILVNDTTYTVTGQRCVLLENNLSASYNITGITRINGSTIKITISTSFYLNIGEKFIITGTNSLDNTYTVSNVEYNLVPGYIVNTFYINTTITDLTYTGTPIITPDFYNINTMRLIISNHSLSEASDLLYISNNNGSVIPIGYYVINEILGPHSILIDYIHSPTIASNIIYTQINENLGNLQKDTKFITYRVESTSIYGKKSSSIGGLSVNLFNNQEYRIEKIIDSNNYIFDCQGICTVQETTGGSIVYISSILNGVRDAQSNTNDGTENTKLFRSISLEGYNYLHLCTTGNETKFDTLHTNSNIKNSFAKILLDQPTGHMCFNSFISTEKIFYTPIPELSELVFSMRTPDDYLYNFNDTDFSFDLEVTTVYEEIENTEYIKTRNRIDYNLLK